MSEIQPEGHFSVAHWFIEELLWIFWRVKKIPLVHNRVLEPGRLVTHDYIWYLYQLTSVKQSRTVISKFDHLIQDVRNWVFMVGGAGKNFRWSPQGSNRMGLLAWKMFVPQKWHWRSSEAIHSWHTGANSPFRRKCYFKTGRHSLLLWQ